MKRNILNMAVAAVAAIMLFSSCDKESEGLTTITYHPSYDFDYPDYVSLGDEFAPTFTAICNGKDVTGDVEYEILDIDEEPVESVDTDNPGIYTIVYSYVNPDNYVNIVERSVYVYNPDLEISLEGEYIIDMENSKYIPKNWTFNEAVYLVE